MELRFNRHDRAELRQALPALTDRVALSTGVGFELFPHDADIGVTGRGRTLAEAFEQAALALTAVVTAAEVQALRRTRVDVSCERGDIELLLVDWLDAIIYEMAVRQKGASILRGALWGQPGVDVARHAPACEPKGATLTALRVARGPDGLWSAGCVIDV